MARKFRKIHWFFGIWLYAFFPEIEEKTEIHVAVLHPVYHPTST